MNLSIFELAYLGSQAKDTPHSGKSKIFTFGRAKLMTDATDMLWMQQLGLSASPDWPLAELLWHAEPLKLARTVTTDGASSSLMLAQPVHLSLQRDSFGLDALISLTEHEYDLCTQVFNTFFADEGLTFIPSAGRQYWFLQTSSPWRLTTYPVQSAMYQNIQAYMPQGQDAQKLRQVMNQVQMLMHEHPVNQQRLKDGLPELNSIWFSANTVTKVMSNRPSMTLIGNTAITSAIAANIHVPHIERIETAIEQGVQEAIILLDDGDSLQWDTLYKAVQSRKIKCLTLHMPALGGTLQITLTPMDCWKFWRQPVSFESLIQQYVQGH